MSLPHQDPVCELLIRELVARRKLHLCEALKVVKQREAAEDVLQNTALKCMIKPPSKAPSNLKCYVAQMVRNASIDYLRKHKRELPTDFDDEAVTGWAEITPICGRVHLEDKQTLCEVIKALNAQPERKQDIFLRCRLKDERQKDIAAELGLSPARVNGVVKQVEGACSAAIARIEM